MGKIPSIDETPKLSEFVPSSSDAKSDVVTRGDVLPDVTDDGFSITKAISDFIDGFKEGFMEVFDNIAKFFGFGDDTPDTPTVQDTREYGLQECSDAAKEIFTPEVLSRWGLMDLQERQDKLTEYAERVADVLGVNINVVFQQGLLDQGAWGYNDGQGNVVLDASFVYDPAQVLEAISTIAHETRHQFQHDVCEHPENYDIDPYTVAEWQAGYKNYTQQMQTAEDPWGYFFNPLEIDARYFGESVVRELTRSFINE